MIKYGSVIRANKAVLPVGLEPKATKPPIGILRVVFTTIEVGIAIFTSGASIPAELAISEAFGIANEVLDAEAGNLNIQGSILNFGLPFFTSYLASLSNARTISKALKINLGDEYLPGIGYTIGRFGTTNRDTTIKGITDIENQIQKQKFDIIDKLRNYPITKWSSYKDIKKFLKVAQNDAEYIKYLNSTLPPDGIRNPLIFNRGTYNKVNPKLAKIDRVATMIEKLGLIYNEGTKALVQKIIDNAKNPRKEGEIEEIVRTLFEYSNKNVKTADEVYQMALRSNEWIIEAGEDSNLTSAFLGTAKSFKKQEFDLQIQKQIDSKKRWSFKESLRQKGWSRTLGSKQFNDAVVQPAQAIMDANDAGRALIENPYQYAMKKIRNYFNKSSRTLETAKTIEDAFTKTGGIVLISQWILGYKVIRSVPGYKFIQISFLPKQWGTKPNVYVWASDWKLEKFILSPGKSYLRYWAMSMGGKKLSSYDIFNGLNLISGKTGLGASFVAAESPFFAAFLNVNALKNVFSLVSNFVENASDVSKGDWTKEWFGKLKKSFVNTAISRSFRLTARTAGLAIGGRFGNLLGRELQRFGTQIGAYSIKQTMAGKDLKIKKQFFKAIATSVRTHTLRVSRRKNGNSVLVRGISVNRKARIYLRTPNTFAPGRPYSGFRLQKKKGR